MVSCGIAEYEDVSDDMMIYLSLSRARILSEPDPKSPRYVQEKARRETIGVHR